MSFLITLCKIYELPLKHVTYFFLHLLYGILNFKHAEKKPRISWLLNDAKWLRNITSQCMRVTNGIRLLLLT